jgi:hypothetical protein
MPDDLTPQPAEAQQSGASTPEPPSHPTPLTGPRALVRDIKLELTSDELANPGTQKVLLQWLFKAEAERDEYRSYVKLYYDADKRASVADEASKRSTSDEALFAIGLAFGGLFVGFAPGLWEESTRGYGIACLIGGAALIAVAAIARIVFKR